MKSIRMLLFATLIGGMILSGCTRPAPGPEKRRAPLGNFDLATQSLIANAKRVVFLIPFSHWDTDWHQPYDQYSPLADQNIQSAIDVAKQDARYRFTLEQVLFVQHFWETHPASREELVTLVHNHRLPLPGAGSPNPKPAWWRHRFKYIILNLVSNGSRKHLALNMCRIRPGNRMRLVIPRHSLHF